ncbi:LexA family protein [Microvirga puerhi]|uniref:Translesion error-prone DNA polymerase V autoproteolytic subunit n=1 Tax=Microvirga puerhi TaxID=2876078 RepID=A0ABS7VVB8_9HYPH|nr:translesion error-prone DNA polymerase V autoproteolytic subunit [Microvirga puerhi]MBZ6078818.1 translesion error-prone DNA polymerase V autoproteolytic subunit [Microvirga puerhi]
MLAKVVLGAEVVVPLYIEGLCAGFPSPADDYIDERIDLARLLVRNPAATFLWRVSGWSMKDAGIYDKDILVVDRSLQPRHNDVVVAIVNGERSLKRLLVEGGRPRLVFENKALPSFTLPELAEIEIWGVARCNVHMLRKGRS